MWTVTNVGLLGCHSYQLWGEEGWSEKKSKGNNSKTEKGKAIFLGGGIAIKFHQDIPYGYLLIICTRSV